MDIKVTPTPELVDRTWGELLYMERKGPFQEHAMKAWQSFWQEAAKLDRSALTMIMGLSHVDCQKQGDDMFTYRAGAIVADDFAHSTGLQQRPFVGGKYAMFEYTGSYANLPKAFEFVMGQMKASKHSMRDDFCVEVYIDSPEDTPEEMLRTQIFIPIES